MVTNTFLSSREDILILVVTSFTLLRMWYVNKYIYVVFLEIDLSVHTLRRDLICRSSRHICQRKKYVELIVIDFIYN